MLQEGTKVGVVGSRGSRPAVMYHLAKMLAYLLDGVKCQLPSTNVMQSCKMRGQFLGGQYLD